MNDKRKWDRITAVVSLFIAVLALGVSLWQGMVTRTHNRLSVRPRLQLLYNAYRDKPPGFYFKNVGTGPAIIRKIEAYIDGKPVDVTHGKILPECIINTLCTKYTKWKTQHIAPGFSIMPGEELLYFGIYSPIDSMKEEEEFSNKMLKVDFYVDFESIYNEQYHLRAVNENL